MTAKIVRATFGRANSLKADELYREANEIDLDPARYAQAERLYTQAVALDPEFEQAWVNLGCVRYRRVDEQGAVEAFNEAIRINPRQIEATYNLGVIHLEEGRPRDAIPFLSLAVALSPEGYDLLSDTHYNLASAYDEIGEPEKARPHWKKSIELDPNGPWVENALRFLKATQPLTVIQGGKGGKK